MATKLSWWRQLHLRNVISGHFPTLPMFLQEPLRIYHGAGFYLISEIASRLPALHNQRETCQDMPHRDILTKTCHRCHIVISSKIAILPNLRYKYVSCHITMSSQILTIIIIPCKIISLSQLEALKSNLIKSHNIDNWRLFDALSALAGALYAMVVQCRSSKTRSSQVPQPS